MSSQKWLHNLTYISEFNRKTSHKWIKGSWKVNITLNQLWRVAPSDNSLGMCHESWFCIKHLHISNIYYNIYSFTQEFQHLHTRDCSLLFIKKLYLQSNLITRNNFYFSNAATALTSTTTFTSPTLSPVNYKGVSKFSNQESSFIAKTKNISILYS